MYNAEHEESGNEWESQLLEEELVKHGSIVKVSENFSEYIGPIIYWFYKSTFSPMREQKLAYCLKEQAPSEQIWYSYLNVMCI